MCGINGIYYFKPNRFIDLAMLISMRDSLIHRGLSGFDAFCSSNVLR